MHKLESVLENETFKILCDFEIQIDHLIPAKRPDLINNKKKKLSTRGFCQYSRPQRENQSKLKEREVLRLCRRTKKTNSETWRGRWYQL